MPQHTQRDCARQITSLDFLRLGARELLSQAVARGEPSVTFKRSRVVAVLATSLVGVALLVAPASSAPVATGTLDLRGSLDMVSLDAPCPPEVPAASTACHSRTAQ